MNNRFITLASVTIVLLLISIGGQNLSAYASNHPPSFSGGNYLKYSNGLVINGQAIDVSKYSQRLDTPIILPVGQSSTITLKIFDNDGPTTIKAAALYGNMHGEHLVTSTGDTAIVYFLDQDKVSVNDPNKLFGTVTAEYKIAFPFVYVTFHVTPISKLDTSNFSVAAMDDHRSFTNSLLIDAIQFS